jgi:hypothetical protein
LKVTDFLKQTNKLIISSPSTTTASVEMVGLESRYSTPFRLQKGMSNGIGMDHYLTAKNYFPKSFLQ